jgi:sporulation protein YqfC
MNVPKMIMVGNSDLVIENYKGVVEYEPERIRLNTGTGVVKITGRMLSIREITSEDVMVSGDIESLEFFK